MAVRVTTGLQRSGVLPSLEGGPCWISGVIQRSAHKYSAGGSRGERYPVQQDRCLHSHDAVGSRLRLKTSRLRVNKWDFRIIESAEVTNLLLR